METIIELLILLFVILINGFLAMSEISIISARKSRLTLRANAGEQKYAEALEIAKSPGNFLSTVQIGITLAGILAGAYGGATIAEGLAGTLVEMGMSPGLSEAIGVSIIVIAITYVSLVFGELIPKQIGLLNPERISAQIARPMKFLSRISYPIVYVLSHSTSLAMRILGLRPNQDPEVTEEEVKLLIDQGTKLGIFDTIEDTIVDRVFMLGDRSIESLITPRTDIVWLDIDDDIHTIIEKIKSEDFSHFPIARENLDNLIGFVKSTDLLAQSLKDGDIDLEQALLEPLYIPKRMPVYYVLERMRVTGYEIAFVLDEFGGILGLVSLRDLLEALVGEIPNVDDMHDPDIVRREDGSILIDGMVSSQQFRELFNITTQLPGEDKKYYLTLGGFVIYLFGDIPTVGNSVDWEGYHLEVVDMDGHRIDKILVSMRKE